LTPPVAVLALFRITQRSHPATVFGASPCPRWTICLLSSLASQRS
jgi:hypothetical protein